MDLESRVRRLARTNLKGEGSLSFLDEDGVVTHRVPAG